MPAARSLALLMLLPAAACAADDRFGDPLPAGAVARCGTVRFRATWGFSGSLAPDARWLATSEGLQIKILDARTGQLVRSWPISSSAHDLRFDRIGKVLAALGPQAIELWDPATGRKLGNLPWLDRKNRPRVAAFSHNGRMLAVLTERGEIAVLEVPSAKILFADQNAHDGFPCDVAFAPDGKTLTTASNHTVCVWDLANRRRVRETRVTWDGVYRLSHDGRLVAAVKDFRVALYDAATGEVVRTLDVPARAAPTVSGDDKLLACGIVDDTEPDEDEVRIVEVATGRTVHRYPFVAVFSPNSRTLVGSRDAALGLWDVDTGKQLNALPAHEGRPTHLAFTAGGRLLVSSASDGTTRGWNPTTGELLWTRPGGHRGLAILPDGQSILSVGRDRRVRRLDLASGRELRRFDVQIDAKEPYTGKYYVMAMAMAPSGSVVSTYSFSGDNNYRAYNSWDVATGRLRSRSVYQNDTFQAFFPDARHVLDLAENQERPPKEFVLRDIGTLQPALSLTLPEGTEFIHAFSPDGQVWATVTTRTIPRAVGEPDVISTLRVWELATGQPRRAIDLTTGGDLSLVSNLCVSPDGRTLAVGRHSDHVEIYDLPAGRRLWRRGGFGAQVEVLAFSPDGQRLASGHADSTILVWDISAARPAVADRPLPAAERDDCWAALAGDAATAGGAMARLAESSTTAVTLFHDRLRPAEAPAAERVRALITDLADPRFAVRDAASKALADLGEPAKPQLTAALAKATSAEQKQRIERLLAPPRVLKSPEALRRLRAVQVLGWLGTPAAHAELRRMAAGDPADRATAAARDTLLRSGVRP